MIITREEDQRELVKRIRVLAELRQFSGDRADAYSLVIASFANLIPVTNRDWFWEKCYERIPR